MTKIPVQQKKIDQMTLKLIKKKKTHKTYKMTEITMKPKNDQNSPRTKKKDHMTLKLRN